MTLYRCSLFGKSGPQPGFTAIHANDDAEARQHAMELLRKSTDLERVEVWRDADLAFRLNQHQLRLESLPPYRHL